MYTFLNNVRSSTDTRENAIKATILSNLSENTKEIQFEKQQQHPLTSEPATFNLSDSTNSLCTTIEAIFLHGLKDSFLRQTINIVAGGEIDRRPEPNFWPPLLVFTHKQTIQQIQSLSQVTTDIGYCRCWIRQSLNDGLLSSYFSNIRKNQSALTPYYKGCAFLRDVDNILLAEGFIGGIEACTVFALPINSSLLNQWTYHPLQMAGIYTPPLRSFVIASGIDVASSLNQNEIPIPKPVQINEVFSESISNSPFAAACYLNAKNPFERRKHQSVLNQFSNNIDGNNSDNVNYDDDDDDDDDGNGDGGNYDDHDDTNLALLLNKIDRMASESDDTATKNEIESSKQLIGGNSIISKTCWSSGNNDNDNHDENVPKTNKDTILSRSNSMTTSITSLRSPIDRYSYNSLLARHRTAGNNSGGIADNFYPKTIDLKDVWDRFESSLNAGRGIIGSPVQEPVSNEHDDETAIKNLGFEYLGRDMIEKFSIPELQQLVEQTCHIANEKGIDCQSFICRGCPNPLSVGSNNAAQVCNFTGYYYCNGCMSDELYLIPARIVYNWDFRKYPVSRKIANFLTDFQVQPFIDLKLLNPNIYMAVDEMASLQSLRIQLNFIRAYLFTCCASIIEKFQKLMWTNEHLYEHIHRYSISDLYQIPREQLAHQLQKAVQFGRDHILECRLCSQKGFICEICSSSKVLYPFDIETTFRCELCGAVFHDHCLDASRPCPKCERKRKREDLPLLIATINNPSTTPNSPTIV